MKNEPSYGLTPFTGEYTLRLELQVFKQIRSGTNFTYDVVRFRPVDLRVVETQKKSAKQVNSP